MILLHGGPGLGETALFRHFNAPLETYFTAVYWDQRGTGKSYYPTISPSSMTVEQFIGDLNELIDAVCERHAPVTHRDLNANANRLIWTA